MYKNRITKGRVISIRSEYPYKTITYELELAIPGMSTSVVITENEIATTKEQLVLMLLETELPYLKDPKNEQESRNT
jgi:hypothetical protein